MYSVAALGIKRRFRAYLLPAFVAFVAVPGCRAKLKLNF
jgi:hypothetical protein